MRKWSWIVLVCALLAMLVVPAVSVAAGASAKAATQPKVKVFAAASLNRAFPAMVPAFKKAYPKYKNYKFVFNFLGTDQLVAQIEQGGPGTADVFAGASTKYGNQLFSEQLIAQPKNFCQNKLVVIYPAKNPARIANLSDVASKTDYVAVGSAAVPIGTYTGQVLDKMVASGNFPTDYKTTIMGKAITCLNVTQVVSLVMINEVDAGFCYRSDYVYAGAKVKKLDIPNAYQTSPLPTYPIATCTGTTRPGVSANFIKFIMGSKGQKILKTWGFLPKPAA